LLEVHGIGPETADSILLYAGKHEVFVVDAYTRRILERHGLLRGGESYEEIRTLFEDSLPSSAELYNEYHALIVHTGKHFCTKRAPDCEHCALRRYLPGSGADGDRIKARVEENGTRPGLPGIQKRRQGGALQSAAGLGTNR